MELHYGPRGTLQIDNARIIWPNFAGKEKGFDREGDRNFTLVFDNEELVDELIADGWNIKKRPSDNDDEPPFMTMKVKLGYKEYLDKQGNVERVSGPTAYLWSNGNRTELDQDSIECLDHIDRGEINLDIRPHDWFYNGREGRTARLNVIEVFQNVDRFQERYARMSREDMLDF